MTHIHCEREEDVQAAVNTGRWPDRVDAELRAHVDHCDVCRDVVEVAMAFADVDTSEAPHPLPDASAVWLRSQMRARIEAARVAGRPISVAQALAFASVVGVLGVLFGASSAWLQRGLQWFMQAAGRLDPRGLGVSTDLVAIVTEHAGLVAMIAVALMAMPLAIYWALREN